MLSRSTSTPFTFMLLAQAIIFVLGWPLEWTEIIVIFVPIFLPLLDNFGIDPLFFGILVALNLQTSFLSPPVAMAPFYLKGVAPKHVTTRGHLRRRACRSSTSSSSRWSGLCLPGHRHLAAATCSTAIPGARPARHCDGGHRPADSRWKRRPLNCSAN